MQITRFALHRSGGRLATFDVDVGGGVTLRDLALSRPRTEPVAWLILPRLDATGAWSISLSERTRAEIAEAALDVYEACTDVELQYEARPLRSERVVDAEVAETLDRAGL